MSSANKYTLKPSLSATFEGIIWKIETDHKQELVAVETRNAENRTAAFSLYNFKTGVCHFKEVLVEESWSWGLDRVTEGLVFLHSYATESSPERKSIICLNADGSIQWQHFNRALYSVAEEGIVAYNPSVYPPQFEILSPRNGELLKFNAKEFRPIEREVILPDVLEEPGLPAAALADIIEQPAFHVLYNEKDCWCYHIKKGILYDQKILITEGDNVLLEDILAADIQKLNPEAFFIQQHHLFCIRNNKHEIVSYLV